MFFGFSIESPLISLFSGQVYTTSYYNKSAKLLTARSPTYELYTLLFNSPPTNGRLARRGSAASCWRWSGHFTAKSLATWQPVKCIPSGVICMGVGAIGSAAATAFDQLDSGLEFNASIRETNDMSPAYYRGATVQGTITCSGTNSGKKTLHPSTVEVFYRAQIDGEAAGVLPGRLTIGFPGRSPWQGVTDALLDGALWGLGVWAASRIVIPAARALILRCGRHNGYDSNLSDFIDTITKILAPANLAAAAAVLQSGPYPSIDGHALVGVQVELGICIATRLNPLLT
ncbi:hypothetical protein PWT90_10227 [Aphanocladium album]|nr:hypothetical protein PWT90_10227 [Aphanocladium album]